MILSGHDVDLLDYRWSYCGEGYLGRFAICVDGKRRLVYQHRLIFFRERGFLPETVDHKNNCRTDNRRENLRGASTSQNHGNRSGLKGVDWRKDKKKWRARIQLDQRQIFLGHFDSEIEARDAYDRAAPMVFGEFAKLNKV